MQLSGNSKKKNPVVNGKGIENSKEFFLAYGIYSNLFKYQASVNIINVDKVACDYED